jgi:hypothetical protein
VLTVPTALSLFFVSSPALTSYGGGAGTVNIAYPATNSTLGSDGNPLQMTGDKITMTFWRPQRTGIGSEPDFVDVEHLRYGIPVASDNRELGCGASRYTGLSPTLVPAPGASDGIYNQLFPLQDSADDRAPDAANAQAHLRHRWLHAGLRHRPSGPADPPADRGRRRVAARRHRPHRADDRRLPARLHPVGPAGTAARCKPCAAAPDMTAVGTPAPCR